MRTSRVGYLRDVRRLTVALSRARLGLYILGRRDVFEACYELKPAFDLLLQQPDKLVLATGEMWPSERRQATEDGSTVPGEAIMEGVEHLGQYVYEMTVARIKQLRAEKGLAEDPEVLTKPLEAIEEGAELGYVQPENQEDEGEGDGVVQPDGFEAEEE